MNKQVIIPKSRLQVWFIGVCGGILLWTCLFQLIGIGELWHPQLLPTLWNHSNQSFNKLFNEEKAVQSPHHLLPASEFLIAFNLSR